MKSGPYPAFGARFVEQAEAGVGDAAYPGDIELAAALDDLEQALDRLETAAQQHLHRSAEDDLRMRGLRAEADALRSLNNAVSERLDGVIERLRASIGD